MHFESKSKESFFNKYDLYKDEIEKTFGENQQQQTITYYSKNSKYIVKEFKQVEEELNLSNLNNKNIIKYYDHKIFEDKSYYIVLENIQINNCTISEKLKKIKNFSEKDLVLIGKQLIDVLLYLNQNRIIHSSLIGDNIIIDSNNNITLIDFGSSILYDQIEKENKEEKSNKQKTDIHKLGELLYEMTGRDYSKVSSDCKDFIKDCKDFDCNKTPTHEMLTKYPFYNIKFDIELDQKENEDLIKLQNENKPIEVDAYEGLPIFEENRKSLWNRFSNWIFEKNFNLACSTLKNGPIPKHIGVIMDGNRRFAERNHLQTKDGHKKGFNTMLELCQWSLALGVKIISVYAFSIENFKRSKSEVEDLMDLANKKFEEMVSKSHKLQQLGVRIRVVGDFKHIPEKTQSILARAVKATENNNKALLNICLSYTAHAEILHSMKTLSNGVSDNLIESEDIDQDLFENCLYIKEDLDILIRTSGEYRLSDFMLWQSCFTNLALVGILWPDFSFLHFVYVIFIYQFNKKKLKNEIFNQHQYSNNNQNQNQNNSDKQKQRVEEFKEYIRQMETDMIEEMKNKG
ncbi:hypothetical protein DICPUDRAFT_150424 [Dictyostelium purpureum]|uniref:Protein kinase domain-containing protein n=1 Tax=Dictyostelium purpureum TaxID=5786 RepID=F0ZGA8_DICPU|nr:uncharacterized protein DICPUDRAFT_150424 [Dictyostelium purpureum]EGC37029.1 hypothetical protein DICPUDRAFT_150424 [Dictyostelium purpureum]|eukprot:XP_003286457.1 hypothetical protein DICPUDRAFT_150424 [Dictyostelium purpureum]